MRATFLYWKTYIVKVSDYIAAINFRPHPKAYLIYCETSMMGLLWKYHYFFSYFFRVGFFICSLPVRSRYLVRLLFLCWITGCRTIDPPIWGLLPPTGTEPTPFRNLASQVSASQLNATTPGWKKSHYRCMTGS